MLGLAYHNLLANTPAEAAAAPPGAIDSWPLFTDAFASPFLGPHRTPPVGLPQPPLGLFRVLWDKLRIAIQNKNSLLISEIYGILTQNANTEEFCRI